MLYQLHWQDRQPPHSTEFVAQSEDVLDVAGADRTWERFHEIVERRKSQCPAGWGPLICDEGAKEFMHSPSLARAPHEG